MKGKIKLHIIKFSAGKAVNKKIDKNYNKLATTINFTKIKRYRCCFQD